MAVKINFSSQKKLYGKLSIIALLIILLMIPTSQVVDLIRERQGLQFNATLEIAQSWGSDQVIKGPLLSIPYVKERIVDDKRIQVKEYLHLLPEVNEMQGDVHAFTKSRSIYDVLIYNSHINFKTSYKIPDIHEISDHVLHINWDKAVVSLGLSDPKGISDLVRMATPDSTYTFHSGTVHHSILKTGVSTEIDLSNYKDSIAFTTAMSLNGSSSLSFEPSGNTTSVNLKSDWPSPSFEGGLLPQSSDIDKDGFAVSWKSNEYHRQVPQYWESFNQQLTEYIPSMGVRFLLPVDNYQKNTRSAKYALLIISLTFMLFFFFEMFCKKKIHTIQYIFIGLSLCIFYLLLLSFSEHIGFNLAYLISSHATIALIGFYSYYILKNVKSIMVLILGMASLYGYIFVLLQMETFALLSGSLGLFIILSAAMYASRKTDWYSIDQIVKDDNNAKS